MPKLPCIILLVGALLGATLQAQPFLVKDIRTGELPAEWPGSPGFVALGGTAYFAAFDRIHGNELWRSDGTPGGTSLVRDVCPGICSSNPAELTVAGGSVFFRADDGAHGPSLWKSDGTAAGTALVKEVEPSSLAEVDGMIAFAASSPGQGQELWRSDGTAAGTFSLGDLRPGAQGSSPFPLGSTGSLLLFWANDGVHGAELWKTDGTVAGTGLVEDLIPGPDGAMPLPQEAKASSAVGSRRLFWATDGSVPGYQLWASDGTPSGTARIGSVVSSGGEFSSGTLNGAVFFWASEPGQDGALWKSDGTENGTVKVKEVPAGFGDLYELTVTGGLLFFRPDGGFGSNTSLWSSDGTEAGTGPVTLPSGLAIQNHVSGFLALGAELFFHGRTFSAGLEPWKTDGTEAGTIPLGDVHSGQDSSFSGERGLAVGGYALFRAETPDGWELWRTDGTPEGTQLVKRIDQSDASGLEPEIESVPWFPTLPAKADLAGTLLFAADDGAAGRELWRSDGSEAGTSLLEDLNPSGDGLARQLTPFGGKVFLVGNFGELWSSDGTEAGTAPFPSGCNQSLTPAGGQLFCVFSGFGDDLRKIGPSDADTTFVKFFNFGSVLFPTAMGSRLFFAASASGGGQELWTSDGTEAGTQQVVDIAPGPASSNPGYLTEHFGSLFFSAADGSTGRELWRSNGTAAGTSLVKDILSGSGSSDPREIVSAGGLVFFVADDGSSGAELWRSDGTTAGTFRVKDIRPGPQSSSIQGLTALGDIVVFAADDGVNGQELWASYGSADAAFLVKDIRPGAGSSYPGAFRVVGHAVLFAADDGTHGLEPWRTDGFEEGTFLVHDVFTGPDPSSPTGFTLSGDYLYFTATDGAHGFELWALDRAALGSTLAATKRVMSPTWPGSTVTYEIVITNTGAGPHPDNPGDEMGDTLPAGLTLTGASADVGTVTLDLPNNRVAWNGALDPGESATVLIEATLSPSAVVYSMIFNQASVSYDSDGDGTHDKLRPSSDPGRGPEEPTLATVSTPPLDFHTVTPCRVLDTRTSSPLASGVKETFAIAGTCGIPPTAKAVVANLTAVEATGAGHLVVHPAGIPPSVPITSSASFPAARARANNAALPLASGAVDATAMVAGGGTVHLILDVSGYFE